MFKNQSIEKHCYSIDWRICDRNVCRKWADSFYNFADDTNCQGMKKIK